MWINAEAEDNRRLKKGGLFMFDLHPPMPGSVTHSKLRDYREEKLESIKDFF